MRETTTEFRSQAGACAATVFAPDTAGPAPVVVMAHGLGGTRAMGLRPYAEHFAAAGYACLVFDYRCWGESPGEPRGLIDVTAQLEDWSAAIDHARTLPGVDPERVVLWGTSFSGGHVIATAAGRGDIAAVLAQGPFTSGIASSLAVRPDVSARLTLAAVRDLVRSARGRPPFLVPVAGPPGSVALMTAPDALPGYSALAADSADFPNRATARSALEVLRYHPGRRAAAVRAPLFVAVCRDDSVAPSGATLRALRRAPGAEVKVYDHGHFAIYRGAAFDEVVADQLAFLTRTVPV